MAKCKNCVIWWLGACAGGYYCQHERKILIEEANERAGQLGHRLGPFDDKVVDCATWMARCANCGRVAVISLDPRPDEQSIYGAAVTEPCSDPELEVEAHPAVDEAGEDLSWLEG